MTLINSDSEIIAMTLVFEAKLELKLRFTNVNVQKIDDIILETYSIVLASF